MRRQTKEDLIPEIERYLQRRRHTLSSNPSSDGLVQGMIELMITEILEAEFALATKNWKELTECLKIQAHAFQYSLRKTPKTRREARLIGSWRRQLRTLQKWVRIISEEKHA
jgi:hypothetical protein